MKLYLDDVRKCPEGYTLARSYQDFVALVDTEIPAEVSFDHDLGEAKTGYDCAQYLAGVCIAKDVPLPAWHCHSANPVGRARILAVEKSYPRMREIYQRA